MFFFFFLVFIMVWCRVPPRKPLHCDDCSHDASVLVGSPPSAASSEPVSLPIRIPLRLPGHCRAAIGLPVSQPGLLPALWTEFLRLLLCAEPCVLLGGPGTAELVCSQRKQGFCVIQGPRLVLAAPVCAALWTQHPWTPCADWTSLSKLQPP